MRVLITALGGDIGARVAQFLESRTDVEAIAGFDILPPRLYLERTEFVRIDPIEHSKMQRFVRDFQPTHVAHLAVYEPGARMNEVRAVERSAVAQLCLRVAASTGRLQKVVMRSSTSVYGHRSKQPDETFPLEPTCGYGSICRDAEVVAQTFFKDAGIGFSAVRLADIAGAHTPAPLVRVLRMPVVPKPLRSDPVFQVIRPRDAAAAIAHILMTHHTGPINVAAAGLLRLSEVIKIGGRITAPIVGPGWWATRTAMHSLGAPVPSHVQETLTSGRVVNVDKAKGVLGDLEMTDAIDVVTDMYTWPEIEVMREMTMT